MKSHSFSPSRWSSFLMCQLILPNVPANGEVARSERRGAGGRASGAPICLLGVCKPGKLPYFNLSSAAVFCLYFFVFQPSSHLSCGGLFKFYRFSAIWRDDPFSRYCSSLFLHHFQAFL